MSGFFNDAVTTTSGTTALNARIVQDGTALNVNMVGGNIQISASAASTAQLQIRNSADNAFVNVGVGAESSSVLHLPVRIYGTGSLGVEPINTNPVGTENALPVRNIPSGIQTITGSLSLSEGIVVKNIIQITGSVAIAAGGSSGGGGGTSSNISSSFPTIGTAIGFRDPGGLMQSANVDNFGNQIITGSLKLSEAIAVSSLPTVTIGNTLTVTGSVSLTQAIAVASMPTTTITGSISLSQVASVTGSVILASAPTVNQGTNPWNITGSISLAQQASITGSVSLTQAIAVSSMPITTVTGGLKITEGVAISSLPSVVVSSAPTTNVTQGTNPWVVTGSLSLSQVAAITGSVSLSQAIAVSSMPITTVTGALKLTEGVSILGGTVTSNQGSSAGLNAPWSVLLVSGSDVVGTTTHPFSITGSLSLTQQATITGSVSLSRGVDISSLPAITGSVVLAVAPTVNQGTNPWVVTGSVSLTQAIAVASMPTTTITGSVIIGTQVGVTGSVSLTQGISVSNTVATSGTNMFPSVPLSTQYLPVRLTDGTNFYVSTGSAGAGGGGSVTQGTSPWIISGSSWIPTITGSISLSQVAAVTGSVSLTKGVDISSMPNIAGTVTANQGTSAGIGTPWSVLLVSGSDPVGTTTHPISITGSISLTQQATITGSVSLTKGVDISSMPSVVVSSAPTTNVTQGTNPWVISGSNWVPTITGSVVLSQVAAITGSIIVGTQVNITGSVSLTSAPTVNQGTSPWVVSVSSAPTTSVTQGTNPWVISGSNWIPTITGSISLSQVAAITGSVSLTSAPTVNQGTNPWIISGSNWIPTITGSISLSQVAAITGSVSLTSAPTVNQGTNPWIISGSSWIPTITGSISLSQVAAITGSISLTQVAAVTGSLSLTSAPTVNQGIGFNAPVSGSWMVTLSSGSLTPDIVDISTNYTSNVYLGSGQTKALLVKSLREDLILTELGKIAANTATTARLLAILLDDDFDI